MNWPRTGTARAGHRRARRALRLTAVFLLCLCSCGMAWAMGGSQPGLQVKVGLSDDTGAGLSLRLGLFPAEPGSRALPAMRTLRLSGDLGTLDLRGIPTCRPTARSPRTSGCMTQPIGTGRGVAYESFGAEGSGALKLNGTARLYSGGQRGDTSKLYAWVAFPDGGLHEAGRSLVIPMISTRKGPGRSELRASLPATEGHLFSVAELLLSIHRTARVDGRLVSLTKVPCPVGPAAEVRAKVIFWGPATPISTTAAPTCGG
jgi:hypothetical protein